LFFIHIKIKIYIYNFIFSTIIILIKKQLFVASWFRSKRTKGACEFDVEFSPQFEARSILHDEHLNGRENFVVENLMSFKGASVLRLECIFDGEHLD
jgi:hypothetical protein